MGKCTRCSAELIGSARFCAVCGAPVAPVIEPAPATVADPGVVNIPAVAPNEQVNPFAATASPSSPVSVEARAHLASVVAAQQAAATKSPAASTDAPAAPPTDPEPIGPSGTPSRASGASPISPLAVSNALSQRGAFQQAVEHAKERARLSAPPPPASEPGPAAPPPSAKKKAGTQMMQNAPWRPPAAEPPAPAAPPTPGAKKAPARTVAMSFGARPPGGGAPQSVAPGAMPSSVLQPAPNSVVAPSQAQPQPPSMHQAAPASQIAPSAYNPAAPYPAAPAYAQARAGWNPPSMPSAAAPYGYGGFPAFAPGARVHVTWSNGQRYPATVSQTSATQCLVVFPDGQQHWVDFQYLTPG